MQKTPRFTALLVVCLVLGLAGVTFGFGNGDITIKLNGSDSVAYIGNVNTLEIWIANDATVGSMSPALEIRFTTSLSWDMVYGSHAPVNEEGRAIGAWNLTDLVVSNDFDDISPDHLGIGGTAFPGTGLPAGSSELCYTVKFTIPPGVPELANAIEVVPYYYSPGYQWLFLDDVGPYSPDFNGNPVADPANPIAPPVMFDAVKCTSVDGDANCDGFANIADAVRIVNWVFKGGPPPCRICPCAVSP
jgi:hypothetical protein